MDFEMIELTLYLLSKRKRELKVLLSIKKDLCEISRINEEIKILNKTIKYFDSIE